MIAGWGSCLVGLVHPRLKLSQPDYTEQREGLPYCQGVDQNGDDDGDADHDDDQDDDYYET